MSEMMRLEPYDYDRALIFQGRRHNVGRSWGVEPVCRGIISKRPISAAGWPLFALGKSALSPYVANIDHTLCVAKEIYTKRKGRKLIWKKWVNHLRDGITNTRR